MTDSFAQLRSQYLGRMRAGLQQLGLADLEQLTSTVEAYHRLETEHLASSWPNLPAAILHPVRTMLAEHPPDLPVDLALLEITRQRPPANEHWEQLPCEPASVRARVEAIRPYLQEGQRCLLLGDDDLLSLHLPLENLTVIDIDRTLLDFLQAHGCRGQLQELDLRQALPTGAYDLIVTDPPWAHQGMQTFLNAALHVLKPGGLLFLSTQPVMLENRSLFEARLQPLQLEKTWPNLNRYAYPESMLEEVLFQLARYDFDPEPAAAIFHTPCLFADFFLYHKLVISDQK